LHPHPTSALLTRYTHIASFFAVTPIMPSSTRKLLRKPLSSLLKRFFILTNGGFSVGTAYGARFLFDWHHSLDKKVALELYEYDQISYLLGKLDKLKPELFVDIGAHAALYSIVLKSRYPKLEVHAFEPDRTNLCQLYGNLFINRLTRDVQVHEFGLSDQDGSTRFDISDETSSRGTRRISRTGNSRIETRRLDSILHDEGKIVAMKIDVEGHECQVLDGARTFLSSNHCFLQVESAPQHFERLKEQLEQLGYRHITTLSDHFFTNTPG
jgi:FkbM family methyltransferase